MAESVKAVVAGVDTYRWRDEDGTVQEAERGKEVTVSQAEFDRIPGALVKAGSKDAKTAAAGDTPDDTTPTGWPTRHEDLDALAEKNEHSFPQNVRTVSEKILSLERAGVTP